MSNASEFRRYAKEAMRWADECKSDEEKDAMNDLALTWMQAAIRIENTVMVPSEQEAGYRPPQLASSLITRTWRSFFRRGAASEASA